MEGMNRNYTQFSCFDPVMHRYAICLLTILLLSSCAGNDGTGDTVAIPDKAIPVIYADYVLIKGSVELTPAFLLLDTGAEDLLLDSLFKSENHLDYDDFFNATITGIGNSKRSIIVITDTVNFSLGDKKYQAAPVPVLNIKPIGGDIIDGLLGHLCFSGEVLEVNYEKKYINIYSSIDSVDLSNFRRVAFRRSGNFCLVPASIRINDSLTISGEFVIDTGSPTSTISGTVADSYRLDSVVTEKVRYYTMYGGIGGESSSWDFICDSVRIASFGLSKANMAFSLDESGVLADGEYMGIIGNNILDRFDVLFDFENRYLYLRPNHSFDKPYVFDRLGFTWVDRYRTKGVWIVSGITENSPAEREGLKIDDRIISVNNTAVSEIPFEDQNDFFKKIRHLKMDIVRGRDTISVNFKLAPILGPG